MVDFGRQAAIDALRDGHDIDRLLDEVHAEDVRRSPAMLGTVAQGLGRTGDERAVGALESIARDTDVISGVRVTAIDALGDLPHARAVQALGACLDDSHIALRQHALRGLGSALDRRRRGEQGDVPIDRIQRLATGALGDPAWPVRHSAARVLAELGDVEAISGARDAERTLRGRIGLRRALQRAQRSPQ